ncbi:hypothetical protein ACFW04_001652 [Cataglyphis niger]
MRRTRHVVLPVRSWQYIGLLIVSLACLTLGLVSRDREGHSGSLAGPELTHRAPHEVDACPNLNPFAQMSADLITEPEKAPKPINDHEIKVSKSPISRRLSRSLSLDRLSRIGSRKIEERSSSNLRAIERLSRSRTRVSDNESVNRLRESRFRTIVESRNARNSYDPVTRLSRSQDLSNRATDRRSIVRDLEHRVADRRNSRSRSTERRELNEIARWQNRVDRSVGRQNSPNLQARMNDRRSLSMERREPSEINRQESRDVLAARREYRDLRRTRVDHRTEMRERRARSVERRDAERSSRREDRERLLKARSVDIARGDIDRNNNLNRRNRKRSLDTRRALLDRVANQERRSRVSSVRNSRKDLVRSNDRRSQFRSIDRMNDFDRETLNRRVRSVESNIERSRRLSSERRSLARSAEINRIDHQRIENRLTGRRSLDRITSRVPSENVRRERINRSQRIVSQRDSRGNVARDNSIINPVRSVYDSEDISSRERRDRHIRSSRSVDRNSMYRREFAKIKESRDRRSHDSSTEQRDLIPERRERTNRVYRSREERRIVQQRSREQIGRVSKRAPEGRVLERRDLRRSSERKIDENARSREASRMTDRRLERNSELRISHGRILEKRSTPNSRKSFERRIDDSPRLREGSRMQNRRVERNSEPRDTISMRMMDRRANRAADRRIVHSLEKRWDARRDQQFRSLEERRARSAEDRFTESLEKDSIRQLRHRLSNLNVKDSSRLTSLRRVIRASHVPERNRQQRTLSAERMVSRITPNDRLSAKWEKNSQDASVEKTGAKIVLKSMDYELFKYPATYDFMKQAFVVALCTVYGLSLYNGKKTLISNNMVQKMQRFIVW